MKVIIDARFDRKDSSNSLIQQSFSLVLQS